MANKVRHTHQYIRVGNQWRCTGYDGCTHFIPGNYHGNPVGRKSLCNDCREEFVITQEDMYSDAPVCETCTARKMHDLIERAKTMSPERKRMLTNMGYLPKDEATEPDAVEVIEPDEGEEN